MKNVRLYLISDSVGETAQKLISAVSAQFPTIDLSDIQLYPFTNDEESLLEILQDALLDKSIVVTTLVNKDLVKFVEAFAKRTGLQHVDDAIDLSIRSNRRATSSSGTWRNPSFKSRILQSCCCNGVCSEV